MPRVLQGSDPELHGWGTATANYIQGTNNKKNSSLAQIAGAQKTAIKKESLKAND
jgi:hypothetical protein